MFHDHWQKAHSPLIQTTGRLCIHTEYWQTLHSYRILADPAFIQNTGRLCIHTEYWQTLHPYRILADLALIQNTGRLGTHTEYWQTWHSYRLLADLALIQTTGRLGMQPPHPHPTPISEGYWQSLHTYSSCTHVDVEYWLFCKPPPPTPCRIQAEFACTPYDAYVEYKQSLHPHPHPYTHTHLFPCRILAEFVCSTHLHPCRVLAEFVWFSYLCLCGILAESVWFSRLCLCGILAEFVWFSCLCLCGILAEFVWFSCLCLCGILAEFAWFHHLHLVKHWQSPCSFPVHALVEYWQFVLFVCLCPCRKQTSQTICLTSGLRLTVCIHSWSEAYSMHTQFGREATAVDFLLYCSRIQQCVSFTVIGCML